MTDRAERRIDAGRLGVRVSGYAGVCLVLDDVGPPTAPPVVLLHGGAQTRHAWGGVVHDLHAAGWRALALDLRGHGESDWAPDGDYSPTALVADVRAVIEYVGQPVVLVGASLGGLIAILSADRHADDVVAVVLVDVVPENNPAGEERIRRFLAANPGGFESAGEALRAVAAYQPHRPPPADGSGIDRYLRMGEDRRLYWHWDPLFLLREGQPWTHGRKELLAQAAARLRCPVALLVGGATDVVDARALERFRATVPHATVRVVGGAHHMVAGDENDAFSAELLRVLDDLGALG